MKKLSFTVVVFVAFVSVNTCRADVSFEKNVRPILKAYCFECHGEGKRIRGSLDLRLKRFAVKGGDTGPAIVPGHIEKSLLLKRLHKKEMPPGKVKVPADKIKIIEQWVTAGAKTEKPEPASIPKGVYYTPEERAYWAFQPIKRPAAPNVAHANLVANSLDSFLLNQLEEKKLAFSPRADAATLIRRAYFDLLGLPPTPEETDAFVKLSQTNPQTAWMKLIDRLLASPHYGERWGRRWLDVAGYADSEGYANDDAVRPYAWKYRDYVIRSFNEDKPFDQFLREQIAGDEMVGAPKKKLDADDVEKLIATGFLRMAPDGTGSRGVDQPVARNQVVADTIEIVSSAVLGMTVQCARCHNHKYDPITQVDYYRMRAILEPALDWKRWKPPTSRRVVIFSDADRAKAAKIEAEAKNVDRARLKRQAELVQRVFERELKKVPANLRPQVRKAKETTVRKRTTAQKKLLRKFAGVDIRVNQLRLYDRKAAAELAKFTAKAAKIRAGKPRPDYIRALTETPGQTSPTFLFDRGEHEAPRQAVTPGGLSILAPLNLGEIANEKKMRTSGRRLAWAKRLTFGRHPLTARVIVNRVWAGHFGRGIVASTDDFGFLGERPTHQALLDWLADDFVKHGWRLKRLHKQIMLSTAYQQSSRRTSLLDKVDPDNHLLGRMSLRRLEAEVIRDSILATSGKLNRKQFGKPVPVKITQEGNVVLGVDTRDNAGRFTSKKVGVGENEFRRSIYVQVRRSQTLSVLETFDAPVMNPNCRKRPSSTVTPQSLLMMNSKFMQRYAGLFAARVQKESKIRLEQVRRAWRLAYGLSPSDEQLSAATMFVDKQAQLFREARNMKAAEAERQAMTSFCQALLSSNRFLYVD